MATPTVKTNVTGLPRRLVAAGLLTEADAAEAQREAAAEKLLLVSYLIRHKKLNARAVASAASEEFGVPAVDLDAVDLNQAPLKDVEPALIEKHHALPFTGAAASCSWRYPTPLTCRHWMRSSSRPV